MRLLILSSAPPRADQTTMGIQQTFHRLRQLVREHEIIVSYTNSTNEPEPEPSSVPFSLVRLPSPALPEPVPLSARPKFYWQLNAWRHALFESVPVAFQTRGLPQVRRAIAQVIQSTNPDLVHVIGELMLYDTPPHTPRLLADFPDLYSNLYRRVGNAPKRRTHSFQNAREVSKLQTIEKRFLLMAQYSLFVSELDMNAARRLAPRARMGVIPNAADLSYFTPNGMTSEGNTLLFAGTLAYRPNIEAAQLLTREILPRVRASIPDARLEIVGYKPDEAVLALQSEHVRVIPNVPDMRPFLERAAVCVVPLLSGSGTRIKIIEAWAMRKAVVSTRIGAEGLDAVDGEHLLLADTSDAFADKVVSLLRNPAKRCELGSKGRKLAEIKYSLQAAAAQLNALYSTLVESAVQSREPNS